MDQNHMLILMRLSGITLEPALPSHRIIPTKHWMRIHSGQLLLKAAVLAAPCDTHQARAISTPEQGVTHILLLLLVHTYMKRKKK